MVISFIAVKLLFFYRPSDRTHKIIKITSAIFLLGSFSSLSEFYYSGDLFPQSSSGGIVGALIFSNLSNIFGVVGSLIFIVIFFLASISLTFSFSWLFVIDAFGRGAKYLAIAIITQFYNFFRFLINGIRLIDLSKFKSKNQPIVERSVAEAKPRELNLPKLKPAIVQQEAGSQETIASVSKADIVERSIEV